MSRKRNQDRARFKRSPSTYCIEQPTPPIEAYEPNCQSIQQEDEYYCPACGLRWEVAEDRPTCLRARR